MADLALKGMTGAEFLTWDDATETRNEPIDGRPVAMAPVAPSHSVIVANLTHELKSRLQTPCYVGNEAGVEHPDRDDTFYEADVVVSCTPVASGMVAIPAPLVVIEVLSPSTIEHDRGRKAYDYRRIALIREIVLPAGEQRHAEVWRLRGAKWKVEDLLDAGLVLESLSVAVPFATIYNDSGI